MTNPTIQAAKIHFKGLNGIRAIAAMSVVISHMFMAMQDFDLPQVKVIEVAGLAVTMFFTLSGFLITFLLLVEKNKLKNISIKQFYIRRVLRIWPLYFFYLFLSIIVLFLYQPDSLNSNIFYYFLLSANVPLVVGSSLPLIFHYWSLAAEEQFYLFWPWVVKKISSLQKWIIQFIFIILILKIISWLVLKKTNNNIPIGLINATKFQCMAIGALGAILFFKKNKIFLRISFSFFTQLTVWVAIAFMAVNKFNIIQLFNDELVAIVTVFLILNVSSNPKTLISLDNSYMDFLGKISFGIYVYHPLVIFFATRLFGQLIRNVDIEYRYAVIYFLITLGTIAIAALSYFFFEKPFLRVKEKYSRVLSSGTKSIVGVH